MSLVLSYDKLLNKYKTTPIELTISLEYATDKIVLRNARKCSSRNIYQDAVAIYRCAVKRLDGQTFTLAPSGIRPRRYV